MNALTRNRKMKKYLIGLLKIKCVKFILLSFLFLLLLSIGFLFGFFYGDNIYTYIFIPFQNTDGNFDYSIFWSAIIGVATIILSIVVAWNSHRYQKMATESSEEYQNQIAKSSREHQSQIEKLTMANVDLIDKLVHLETFKFFPQVKVSLSEMVDMQSEEHIQLYCNTLNFYNHRITKEKIDELITIIHCKLENVGISYVDQILYEEIVILLTSHEGKKQIVYRGKPEITGCSSLFVSSSKKLLISFPKTLLVENNCRIEIITHYQLKNGKEQLWTIDWANQIYSEIMENNGMKNLHCTSTRLYNKSFNEFILNRISNN